MIKKIALFMLAILPVGLMAQNQKIGHVNSQELISLMPELDEMDKKIQAASEEWEKELLKYQEEYFSKAKEFQDSQATLSESIKEARQAELQALESRIGILNQQAQQDLAKKNQELAEPILEKVRKAIADIAKENNISYVLDMASQSVVYTGGAAQDITPLVKKKLNLKDKPAG